MIKEMKAVVEYLEEHYEGCVDCCGEDDEVNTIPAKIALENAKVVLDQMQRAESHSGAVKLNPLKMDIALMNACMNISDLAKVMGCHRITIDSARRRRSTSYKTVGMIAKALNVPAESLID